MLEEIVRLAMARGLFAPGAEPALVFPAEFQPEDRTTP
jgi:hypothetical protein